MGHSGGLRAGTRVRQSNHSLNPKNRSARLYPATINAQIKLMDSSVCLLARLQEEGYDQAVHILKTIQVRFLNV